MRVCLLTPEYPPAGGIGTYVRDLACQLSQLGAQVTVCGVGIHQQPTVIHSWGQSYSLTRRAANPLARLERQVLTSLGRLPVLWRVFKPLNKNRVQTRLCRSAAKQLDAYVKSHENDFDVIEIPNWPGHGAFLAPRFAKLVVRLSSPANECGMPANAILRLEASSCRNADLVIGNSHAILDKTKQLYGLDLSKTLVIPHGISDVKPAADLARRSDGLEFLYVGRSEYRKGTDILLSCLADFFAAYPNSRFTFVGTSFDKLGESTDDRNWLTLARNEGKIRCLGRVSDEEKLRLYSTSHWIVIPSRFESFGLVAVESLCAGTPFIAAASGGLVETCERARSSVMVAPNTPASWSLALKDVASKGVEFAECLRLSCREDFEKHFTAERMAAETIKAYEKLLAA